MKPKRFRDTGLTADEIRGALSDYMWHRRNGVRGAAYITLFNTLFARAKRLLPLWRKAGLEALAAQNWHSGYEAGRNNARPLLTEAEQTRRRNEILVYDFMKDSEP